MNIVGLSSYYHDSACCLLSNGKLLAAAQEERFTRIKNDPSFPVQSFKYCLKESNLTLADIDVIAYYEKPERKLARQLRYGQDFRLSENIYRMDPRRVENDIRVLLGYYGCIEYVGHHVSHAASSFLYSPFDEAAIMTVDGVGEWETGIYGYGKVNEMHVMDQLEFPNSIGLLYSAITSFLGFRVNSGEYKVMGLAPYGKPRYGDLLSQLFTYQEHGKITLNLSYFDFIYGERMYSKLLSQLLSMEPRVPESSIEQCHMDLASSIQNILEECLLHMLSYLGTLVDTKKLCMSGGVALNCTANRRVLRDSPFNELFIQPASGDAGCCLGAAAYVYSQRIKTRPEKLSHVYLGMKYDDEAILCLLDNMDLQYEDYKNNSLTKRTAELLAQGNVVGWFQGAMEFGPRALGNRSILGDPRGETMRERINQMVKKREGFRPFAPAVLEEEADKHFKCCSESPFMTMTYYVESPLSLPAVTHVDKSARVQTVSKQTNPEFYALIKAFYDISGCPMLLNTSFNVRGEPIVATPVDAIKCFVNTKIDYLVIGRFLIGRHNNNMRLLKYLIYKDSFYKNVPKHTLNDQLYTFL